MTKKEMQKLKKGQRVVFTDGVSGTVTDANKYCVTVRWDDGQVGSLSVEDGDCVSMCACPEDLKGYCEHYDHVDVKEFVRSLAE